MSTRTAFWITFTLILIAILSGVLLWDRLPPQMASHWNAADEVDGYTSRFWGVFLMPLVSLVLAVLFWAIPLIDPLRENIARFRRMFNTFIVIVIAFLLHLHFLTLIYNLGIHFRMSRLLLPAMGVLIYFVGELVRQAKRNWFIGIRTPWTLSDDRVWAKTHRLGSILLRVVAVVIGASAFLGEEWRIRAVLSSLLIVVLVPWVYSYWLFERYRREALLQETEGKG